MILIGTVMPVPTLASLLAKSLILAMPMPQNIWDAITSPCPETKWVKPECPCPFASKLCLLPSLKLLTHKIKVFDQKKSL